MTVVKSVSDGLRDSETQLNLNRHLRISHPILAQGYESLSPHPQQKRERRVRPLTIIKQQRSLVPRRHTAQVDVRELAVHPEVPGASGGGGGGTHCEQSLHLTNIITSEPLFGDGVLHLNMSTGGNLTIAGMHELDLLEALNFSRVDLLRTEYSDHVKNFKVTQEFLNLFFIFGKSIAGRNCGQARILHARLGA